jgi:hypothetical protein
VPVVAYAVLLVLLPVLGVPAAMAAGWWSSTGRATSPAAVSSAERPAGVEATGTGPGVAPADVADVKGSTTVQQVVDAFPPVTTNEIVAVFGAPADTPSSTQLKTLVESGDGLEIPAFRSWLDERRTP